MGLPLTQCLLIPAPVPYSFMSERCAPSLDPWCLSEQGAPDPFEVHFLKALTSHQGGDTDPLPQAFVSLVTHHQG